ncbi:MAG: hypothetical protein ABSH49_18130 [Bryobacteraceae bacterium]
MTSLHLKLNQLSLTTMSKQLDQMIADILGHLVFVRARRLHLYLFGLGRE